MEDLGFACQGDGAGTGQNQHDEQCGKRPVKATRKADESQRATNFSGKSCVGGRRGLRGVRASVLIGPGVALGCLFWMPLFSRRHRASRAEATAPPLSRKLLSFASLVHKSARVCALRPFWSLAENDRRNRSVLVCFPAASGVSPSNEIEGYLVWEAGRHVSEIRQHALQAVRSLGGLSRHLPS